MQYKQIFLQFAVIFIRKQMSDPRKFFNEAWIDNDQLELNDCPF